MPDKPVEKSIPVEEMVTENSPELVKRIAVRVDSLKVSARQNTMATYIALTAGGMGLAAEIATSRGDSLVLNVVPGIAMFGGLVFGTIFHHEHAKNIGEADALTGVLASHLLKSVEQPGVGDVPPPTS